MINIIWPFWVNLTVGVVTLAYLVVLSIQRWAIARQLLDLPNQRSSHTLPTPHGGGLAIAGLTCGGGLLYLGWLNFSAWNHSMLIILIASLFIAIISWWDDLACLSNRLRFTVHAVAALGVVIVLETTNLSQTIAQFDNNLSWLIWPLAWLWLVGLTNVYNFMDGIDGLSGTQAVVTGIVLIWSGWYSASLELALLGMLITASSLGFLGHNWHPAYIFMGDVGSAFLGFIFAALSLFTLEHYGDIGWIGVASLWPFLWDGGFTLLRRLCKGENIFQAHRSHLYQRLVILGYSHAIVTMLYGGLALISTGLALGCFFGRIEMYIVLIALGGLGIALWIVTLYQESYNAEINFLDAEDTNILVMREEH